MDDIIALKERFEERKTDFIQCVNRLQEALDQPANEFIRDSVIKRYETAWETGWKMLKLWLSYQGIATLSPRDVWKEAFSIGILEGEPDTWATAQRMRNLTVHTYDEAIAEEVYQFVKNDVITLFQDIKTKAETWQIQS